MHNANTETEHIETVYELDQLLSDFCLDSNKKLTLAGDFNLFFDPSLKGSGGKPLSKKKYISKLLQMSEQNNLVDIWRIHNLSLKRYTF